MPFRKPQHTGRQAFLGRANEIQFFLHAILEPEYPSHNILSISGQGGVGKSTLLTHFMEETRKDPFQEYCHAALVTEKDVTPARIMERFAQQLGLEGEFKKASARYKELLNNLEVEREAMRKTLLDKAPALAGTVVEDVPLAGKLLKEGTELAAGYLINRYRTQQLLKDAEQREDPIGDLTKAFVKELNQYADTPMTLSATRHKRQKKVLLFFDTFEQLASDIGPWLLDHFLVAEISPSIVLVIAGRMSLEKTTDDPKRWLPYLDEHVIHFIPLESFSQEETYVYLQERSIGDPQQLERLWQLSRGLPLYLSMLTTNAQGQVDPTASVVANFLRWIPEQEKVKRQLALDASLFSMPFNQDDLDAFSYLEQEDHAALFTWLIEQPFIRQNQFDGRYIYHDLAQELFSRHLYQRSANDYTKSRQTLINYYQSRLDVLEHEAGQEVYTSKRWQEYQIALAVQLFFLPGEASRARAVECVFTVYEHTGLHGESISALRQLVLLQTNFDGSADTYLVVGALLQFLEAAQDADILKALDPIIDRMTHNTKSSKILLSYLYRLRGRTYRDLEKFDSALHDYNQALSYNPQYANAYAGRGETYRFQELYTAALEDFDKALELDQKDSWTYARRGLTYYLTSEYTKAVADLNQAIALGSEEELWVLAWLGETYRSQLEYQQALDIFSRALTADPNYISVYTSRGHLFRENKQYEKAIADYTKTIELNPQDTDSYFYRALAYSGLKQSRQAILDYTKVLDLDPNDAYTYNNRGFAYADLKQYEQALTDYTKALYLDPSLSIAYANRAIVYAKLKQYEQAIADHSKAIELDPENVEFLERRAWIYTESKEYDKSLIDINMAIDLEPDTAFLYLRRGYVYLWLRDMFQAQRDFSTSWQLGPTVANNGWMVEFTSMCWQKPSPERVDQLIAIAHTEPESDEAFTCYGVASWLQGDNKQALQHLERAIAILEDSEDAYFWRGLIFASLGDEQRASSDIEKALEIGLPPILLLPLRWLQEDQPDVYEHYVLPLFNRYDLLLDHT